MLFYDRPIRDIYHRHYRLLFQGQPPPTPALTPVERHSLESAESFIRQLRPGHHYWRRLLLMKLGEQSLGRFESDERSVARQMLHRRISFYHIKHLDGQFSAATAATRVALPANNGQAYALAPASLLLLQPRPDFKSFSDQKEALNFLGSLNLSQEQQSALAEKMALPSGVPLSAIANALLKQNFIITVSPDRHSPPQAKSSPANAPLEEIPLTPPSLGPHDEAGNSAPPVAVAPTGKEEPPPLCQRNSLTVSCSHGRSVTLAPDTAHMPNLDVIATSKTSNKRQADTITIESDITDICPEHTRAHLIIGKEAIQVSHRQAGKSSTIHVYANPLTIQSNPFKYAWLAKIKPRTYPIYPGPTCDDSRLKHAGKGIELNVYPQVAWDWGVSLGYGKDEHKIEAGDNGSYTDSLSQKRFGIDGHIKLIHDNESSELSSEFKQAIASSRQQLESITTLVDGVLKRFDEGKEPTVTVTWPNLTLNLKTELAEGSAQHRVVAFDFGISAAPFFGLDVKVDILPVLLAPLAGGLAGKKIIEDVLGRIKKGVGDREGVYSAEGSVSVIMTGQASFGCEARFKGDFSNNTNRIEKVSGKPVEGKIEFSAEGIIDIKGHLLKIKIELVAGIGIKSSITLGMDIDSDEKGYYWQPQARFDGVKVYISKLVKTKRESGGEDGAASWGVGSEPNLTVKETEEYVWIKEKNLATSKRYFIEY